MASKKKASAAEPDITAMGINAEAAAAIAAQVVQRTEEKFGAESAELMKPLLQHGRLLLAIDTQQHAAVEALTRCCMLAEVHDGATVQANCLTMMSIAALSQFEYAAAENAASQALRLVTMMPDELITDVVDQLSIQAQNVLGEARRELGFPQKGFDMHRSALENARQIGVNHLCADATRGMGKCMVALAAGTQADDATDVLSDAVLLYREAWGDSALTARALCEYGEHLRNCERYDEAEKALREAVQLQSVCCKRDSVEVAQVCKILGSLLLARKQSLAEALALVERGFAIFDKLRSRPHNTAATTAALADRSASTLTFKGMILDETGKYDEAAMVQRTVLERYTQLVGADHPYTQAMKQQLEFYEAKGDRQVAVVAEQINSGAAIGTVLATAGKSEPQGSSASSQRGKKQRRRRKRPKTKAVNQPPPSATPSDAHEASAKGGENAGEEPSLGLPSTSRGPSVIVAPLIVAAASSKPAPLVKSFAAAAAPLMAAAPVRPVVAVAAVPAAATPASAVTRAKQPKQPKQPKVPKQPKEVTSRHPGSQDHRQKYKNNSSAHMGKANKKKGSVPAAATAAAAATDPAVPRPGAAPAIAPGVAALDAPDDREEVVTDEGVSTTTPVPAELVPSLIQPADEADVLEVDEVLAVIQPSSETAVLEVDEVVAIIEPATESQIEDFDDDNSTDDELLVDAPAPAPAPASTAAVEKLAAVAAVSSSSSSSSLLVVTGLRFASETGSASEKAPEKAAARKATKLVRMQSNNNNTETDAAEETAETVTADADADAGQAATSPKAKGIAAGPVDPTPAPLQHPPPATDGDNSTLLIIGSCVIGSAVAYLLWRQLSAGQARR